MRVWRGNLCTTEFQGIGDNIVDTVKSEINFFFKFILFVYHYNYPVQVHFLYYLETLEILEINFN